MKDTLTSQCISICKVEKSRETESQLQYYLPEKNKEII